MPVEAVERDEFRTPVSPPEIRFVQVTSRANQTSWLRDQNGARWTSDSRRFVFVRESAVDISSRCVARLDCNAAATSPHAPSPPEACRSPSPEARPAAPQ